jgi:carbon-monoxide dehydrogenase medium subunit
MYVKMALRRAQAISLVNAAIMLTFEPGADWATRRIASARVALGAVAPTIIRCPEAEAILVGATLTDDVIRRAAALARSAARPIDDVRATADYRRRLVAVSVGRALRGIAAGSARGGLPEQPVQLAVPLPSTAPTTESEVIATTINGAPRSFAHAQHKTLLRLLREDAGLPGTKEGCAEGECGACTVFLDGVAVMACLVPAPRAAGATITTIEGLSQGDTLHPLQQAFIDEGAVQCGYCTPGFLMAGAKLLEERDRPGRTDILQAVTGNLCRCTGYYKILSAIEKAAGAASLAAA